jgi:hypothetical protein
MKILPHDGDRTKISAVPLSIDWSILRLSYEYRLWICPLCNAISHFTISYLSDPNKDHVFRYHKCVSFLLLRSWAPYKYKTKGKIGILCFSSFLLVDAKNNGFWNEWQYTSPPPSQLQGAPDALVSASLGFYSDSKMCEILFICVVSWWWGLNIPIDLSTSIYWDFPVCITAFIFPGEHSYCNLNVG